MNLARNNRLAALAADIRAEHVAIETHAGHMATKAVAAGRMLIEAKAAIPHGQWTAWLQTETGLGGRTARRYMQIAQSGLETATVANLGIRGAVEAIAKTGNKAAQIDANPAYQEWLTELRAAYADVPTEAREAILQELREDVAAARFAQMCRNVLSDDEMDRVADMLESKDGERFLDALRNKLTAKPKLSQRVQA